MSSSCHSLIMGVAVRYPVEAVLPFLKSLRRTSYQGKVCLFVGRMTEDAVTTLRGWADDVVVLDNEYGHEIARSPARHVVPSLARVRATRRVRRLYPALFRMAVRLAPPDRRRQLWVDLEQSLEGLQALRYQHYRDYLDHRAADADLVMLSDVRDVIFQHDPFDHDFASGLEVFLEAEHLTISHEPFNRRWIQNLYGGKMLRAIGHQTASCSGTTMGTGAGMRRYLAAMTEQIMGQERPLGSHDQGIHNYLLRDGHLDPVTIYANGLGPVLTMGSERGIRQDADGHLLNRDGAVAPVVHQYDRHVELAEELTGQYQ